MKEEGALWERSAFRAVAGETLRPGGFQLTDRAATFLEIAPGWRVLDIGCGLGATVRRLRSRYGAQAYGVELSTNQLKLADSPAGLVRSKGDCLPFADSLFDAVVCECVFSLFSDQLAGMREIRRVVAPGGYLILSDLHTATEQAGKGFSCAERARPVAVVRDLLEAHDFEIQLLEDHTPLLKELAVKLAWTEESGQCACSGGVLGYYLLVACKMERQG